MKPHVKAIAWRYFYPYRWAMIGAFIYLAVIYALGTIFYSNQAMIYGNDINRIPMTSRVLVFLLLAPAATLLSCSFVFFTDANGIEGFNEDSTLRKSVLTSPLSTRELVFWPMLFGMLFNAIAWIAFAPCIEKLWFVEIDNFPKLWPPLMIACLMAWAQAVAWRPSGSNIGKVFLGGIVLLVLVVFSIGLGEFSISESMKMIIPALLIVVAYITAVDSVAKARCGDRPEWNNVKAIIAKIESWIHPVPPHFQNAQQALNWYEWRVNGKILLCLTGFFFFLLPFLMVIGRVIHGYWVDGQLTVLLWIPILLSGLLAIPYAAFGTSTKTKKVHSFVLSKPVACKKIIHAKYYSTLKSIITAYFSISLVIIITALVLRHNSSSLEILTHNSSLPQLTTLCLGLVSLIVFAWCEAIVGMTVGLTGRAWVMVLSIFTLMGSLSVFMTTANWFHKNPEYNGLLRNSFLLFVILIALATVYSLRLNFKMKLMTGTEIKKLAGIGSVLLVVVMGCSFWVIHWKVGVNFANQIMVLIILLIPMLAIALAPLALHWNRHR